MKILLATLLATLLAGCAGVSTLFSAGLDARQQAHDSLMAVGIQTLQFAEDYARLQEKARAQIAAQQATEANVKAMQETNAVSAEIRAEVARRLGK